MNSSPPIRATTSSGRVTLRSASAKRRSARSPRRVAVDVVQRLEVVEVGHDQAVARGAVEQGRRPLLEAAPVQQPGERVGGRLELALGEGAGRADRRPGAAGDGLQRALRLARRSARPPAATECSTPTTWPRLVIGRHSAVSGVPAASARSRRNWQAVELPAVGEVMRPARSTSPGSPRATRPGIPRCGSAPRAARPSAGRRR